LRACLADAIFAEDDVPADQKEFIELNADVAAPRSVITEKKEPPARHPSCAGKGRRTLRCQRILAEPM
jgi:ferredoxin